MVLIFRAHLQYSILIFAPRSVYLVGLPCVTRPCGLALLRHCAADAACRSPPLRVPFLRSKKPFEVPLSTIQKAFFISRQLFGAPVGISQLIIYCRYFFIPCKDLYSAPPWRALLNFFINSLSGSNLP